MSTDLTSVRDHPSVLLISLADNVPVEFDGGADSRFRLAHANWPEEVLDSFITASRAVLNEHMRLAAQVLRDVEQVRGVTFAALDNDALATLREVYAETGVAENPPWSQVCLRSAINDLLGLE